MVQRQNSFRETCLYQWDANSFIKNLVRAWLLWFIGLLRSRYLKFSSLSSSWNSLEERQRSTKLSICLKLPWPASNRLVFILVFVFSNFQKQKRILIAALSIYKGQLNLPSSIIQSLNITSNVVVSAHFLNEGQFAFINCGVIQLTFVFSSV